MTGVLSLVKKEKDSFTTKTGRSGGLGKVCLVGFRQFIESEVRTGQPAVDFQQWAGHAELELGKPTGLETKLRVALAGR